MAVHRLELRNPLAFLRELCLLGSRLLRLLWRGLRLLLGLRLLRLRSFEFLLLALFGELGQLGLPLFGLLCAPLRQPAARFFDAERVTLLAGRVFDLHLDGHLARIAARGGCDLLKAVLLNLLLGKTTGKQLLALLEAPGES
jgi:hypothetical protein